MAAVQSRASAAGSTALAIVAGARVTLVFSGRRSTGSPRRRSSRAAVATTVPPTVFFKPEITPFIKLFTKRVQMRGPRRRRQVYATAPWWEKLVIDGGERVLKVGKGKIELSAYPSRFLNSLIVAVTSTVPRGRAWAPSPPTASRASRCRARHDLLFFILSTRMLPPVVVAIPMFLMYRAVGLVDTHVGLIILYTAFNLSFSVWLMKGFIDEIPEGVRGGGAGRRLHAHAGLLQDRAAGGHHRHRRHRGVLLHHRVERVCLRADDDQPPRPDRAALHPVAARLRPAPTGPSSPPAPCCSCCRSRSSPSCCATHLLRGVTFGAIRK